MKPQIKKCKGFNENCCKICKRLDSSVNETLVKNLGIDREEGTKTCIYWIYSISQIKKK